MRFLWFGKYEGRTVHGKARLTAGSLLRTGFNLDVQKKGFYILASMVMLFTICGFLMGYLMGRPTEYTVNELMAIPDEEVQECETKLIEDDAYRALMCRQTILEAD